MMSFLQQLGESKCVMGGTDAMAIPVNAGHFCKMHRMPLSEDLVTPFSVTPPPPPVTVS